VSLKKRLSVASYDRMTATTKEARSAASAGEAPGEPMAE
jgi:hypothetical protein